MLQEPQAPDKISIYLIIGLYIHYILYKPIVRYTETVSRACGNNKVNLKSDVGNITDSVRAETGQYFLDFGMMDSQQSPRYWQWLDSKKNQKKLRQLVLADQQ